MMRAKVTLPKLAIVTIDYDAQIDYATSADNAFVLLRSVSLGDTITPNDLIQFGMIYHLDTSDTSIGTRVPQGWVKRSHAVDGIISVDLAPVFRSVDYIYDGDPIVLDPAAYSIEAFFVDVDVWSFNAEYSYTRTNGLISSITPLITIGNGARVRINYLAVC